MGITCVYIKIRTTLCILFCNLFFHLVHICRTFHFVCPYLPKKLLYNIPLYWSLFNCSFLYEHLYGFEFFININDTVRNSFHFEHFGKHLIDTWEEKAVICEALSLQRGCISPTSEDTQHSKIKTFVLGLEATFRAVDMYTSPLLTWFSPFPRTRASFCLIHWDWQAKILL